MKSYDAPPLRSRHYNEKDSKEKAEQAQKNQQAVKDICDSVVQGQGVGLLTIPKLKRLMEDESLRDLACSRLNFALDTPAANEDDPLPTVLISRAQYKGILRVLQACIAGIEAQYQ